MKNKWTILGFTFAIFWASASAATKVALESAQPFVIAIARFLFAALLMLAYAHGIKKYRMPTGAEWKKIMIYGLLNISIYLGLYVVAMQKISAGLGTLAVAINPVFISLLSAAIFKKPAGIQNILSLIICMAGVFIAAYPLLQTSYASMDGILIIMASMLAYSLGAIYFSSVSWQGLHILTINGWQTLLGGLFLLPVMLLTYRHSANQYDIKFWGGTLWLVVMVSIVAVQCWLYLSHKDSDKASYWLFLCPIFGFMISAFMLGEPLSWYTGIGVLMVLGGLYLRNARRLKAENNITD